MISTNNLTPITFAVAAVVAPAIIALWDDVELTEIHNSESPQTSAAFYCIWKAAFFPVTVFDQYVLFIYNNVKQ